MLNLEYTTAYQYNKQEKEHLNSLRASNEFGKRFNKRKGKYNKTVWYDSKNATKAIKNNISQNLLYETKYRCSYCSRNLLNVEKPIDHFIPNAEFPKYSFHPLNLIQSCGYCNSSNKLAHNPVINFNKKYHKIVFNIVHPIIHNVAQHFFYETQDRVSYDQTLCSSEAINTISIMGWNTIEHNLFLAELSNQKLITENITEEKFIELIAETATYQPYTK